MLTQLPDLPAQGRRRFLLMGALSSCRGRPPSTHMLPFGRKDGFVRLVALAREALASDKRKTMMRTHQSESARVGMTRWRETGIGRLKTYVKMCPENSGVGT